MRHPTYQRYRTAPIIDAMTGAVTGAAVVDTKTPRDVRVFSKEPPAVKTARLFNRTRKHR